MGSAWEPTTESVQTHVRLDIMSQVPSMQGSIISVISSYSSASACCNLPRPSTWAAILTRKGARAAQIAAVDSYYRLTSKRNGQSCLAQCSSKAYVCRCSKKPGDLTAWVPSSKSQQHVQETRAHSSLRVPWRRIENRDRQPALIPPGLSTCPLFFAGRQRAARAVFAEL